SILGPVAAIARHAQTVGEAFDAIRRYMPYHTPGGLMSTGPSPVAGHTRIRYELSLPPEQPRRQAIELSYSIANHFLRMVAPGGPGWTVHFRHAPALTPESYRAYFGCEVRFGQPDNAIDLPDELLKLPMDQSNPELARVAEAFVAHVVKRHPLDLPRQVEILAARQLAVGGCSLEGIARQLAVNERSLQRRLAVHGVKFEEIVDRLRQARAREYLPHSAIPLAQVAGLLGYSDQSSFNRACKRWFGLTPMQVRASGGITAY
ncbi:MAG TPA: AraC family transcriptional regulator ligand-binding domain-containing protein, partial [Fluviicoccus sp.]|nr:AraC family transcriptional regulator ligand-binding domain-containing protein [Fluviicoccus sp.]